MVKSTKDVYGLERDDDYGLTPDMFASVVKKDDDADDLVTKPKIVTAPKAVTLEKVTVEKPKDQKPLKPAAEMFQGIKEKPVSDRGERVRAGLHEAFLTPEGQALTILPALGVLESIFTKGKPEAAMKQQELLMNMPELNRKREAARLEQEKAKLGLESTQMDLEDEKTKQELKEKVSLILNDPVMSQKEKDQKLEALYIEADPWEAMKNRLKAKDGIESWQAKQMEWTRIQAMPDSTPEEKAAKKTAVDNYYAWTAPSVAYQTTGQKAKDLVEQIRLTSGPEAAAAAEKSLATFMAQEKGKSEIPGAYTAGQYQTATFATRMKQSESALDRLASKGFNPGSFRNAIIQNSYNALKTPEERQYAQAMRNFINATLRRESGAAISEGEFDTANKQYFAQMSDDPVTLAQKKENRETIFTGMRTEAGGAFDQVTPKGSRYNPLYPKTEAEFNEVDPGSYYVDPDDGKLYVKE
jgi:hypothetical protein